MRHEMPQAFLGGGAPCAEKSRCKTMFLLLSASVWRNRRICGGPFLRKALAQLCVRFRGWAWCARFAICDHARFSRGALAAQGLGVRVDALLHRLAVERRSGGCAVGTAVGDHATLSSGIAACASCSAAHHPRLCVCFRLGEKRPVKAAVRSLWWEIVARARPQAASCACQPRA